MSFFKQEIIAPTQIASTDNNKVIELLDLPNEVLFKITGDLELLDLIQLRKVAALNYVFFNQIFQKNTNPRMWFEYLQLINFTNQHLFYNLAFKYKSQILVSLNTIPDFQEANHIALMLPITYQNNRHMKVSEELFNELIQNFLRTKYMFVKHIEYITTLTLSLINLLNLQQIDKLFTVLNDINSTAFQHTARIKIFIALLPRLNNEQIAKIPEDFHIKKFNYFFQRNSITSEPFIVTMNFLVYLANRKPGSSFNIIEHIELGFSEDPTFNEQRNAILDAIAKYDPKKINEFLNKLLTNLNDTNRHIRKTAWTTLPILGPYLNTQEVQRIIATINQYLESEHKHIREAGLNMLSALAPRLNEHELYPFYLKVKDMMNDNELHVRKAALKVAAILLKQCPEPLKSSFLQPILNNIDSDDFYVHLAALNASIAVLNQFDTEQIERVFKGLLKNLCPERFDVLNKVLINPFILASRFNETQINQIIDALLILLKTKRIESLDAGSYRKKLICHALITLYLQLSEQQNIAIFDTIKDGFRDWEINQNVQQEILRAFKKWALFITDQNILMQIISFIDSLASDYIIHTSTKEMALNMLAKLSSKFNPALAHMSAKVCIRYLRDLGISNNHAAVNALFACSTSLSVDELASIIDSPALLGLMSAHPFKKLDILLKRLPASLLSHVPDLIMQKVDDENKSWASWSVLIQRLNHTQIKKIWDYCLARLNDEDARIVTNVFRYLSLCIPVLTDEHTNTIYEALIAQLKERVGDCLDGLNAQKAAINTLTTLTPKLPIEKVEQITIILIDTLKSHYQSSTEGWKALIALAKRIDNKHVISTILNHFLQSVFHTINYPEPRALRFDLLYTLLPKLDSEQLIQVLNAEYEENLQELSNALNNFIMSGQDKNNTLIQLIKEQQFERNNLILKSLLTLFEGFHSVPILESEHEPQNTSSALELR